MADADPPNKKDKSSRSSRAKRAKDSPPGRGGVPRGGAEASFTRRFWRGLLETYAAADPRSLGVLRILLGTLLFFDVARRIPDLVSFFTNDGWLSNHFAMFRPMSSHLFSIYHAFSTPGEVRLLFFLHLTVNLLFIIGYKTRLMHILAAILITSLNSRNIITENGGYVMLNLLVVWTLILPMGRRFSVDSLLLSLRSAREASLSALNNRRILGVPTQRVYSLAVTAVLLQWAVNYYFNTVQKAGGPWHDGTAIHYFMGQGRLLRPFGIWLREVLPLSVTSALTYSTLVMEGAIVLLLLTPVFSRPARMVAWALAIALHLGIASFARLGPFSFVMMTAFAAFIPAGLWTGLRQRMQSTRPGFQVLIVEDNGLSMQVGRILKRFDLLHKLEFVPADAAAPKGLCGRFPALKGKDSPLLQGAEAGRAIFEQLPLFRPLVWLGHALGLLPLLSRGLGRLLERQGELSAWFGLDRAAVSTQPRAVSGARRWLERWFRGIAEALVLLLMIACGSQVLMENRVVPEWLKPKTRPDWMTAVVTYPRLFQGWSMFAPEPPRDDGWIIVDGRTKDGRRLDPLTGEEPNFSMDLPDGPDLSAQWSAFNMRIHEERFRAYLNGLREYLRRHHEVEGHPDDELVAFDVWYASRITLPPGQGFTEPTYRKLTSLGFVKDSGVPRDKIWRPEPSQRSAGTPHRPRPTRDRTERRVPQPSPRLAGSGSPRATERVPDPPQPAPSAAPFSHPTLPGAAPVRPAASP